MSERGGEEFSHFWMSRISLDEPRESINACRTSYMSICVTIGRKSTPDRQLLIIFCWEEEEEEDNPVANLTSKAAGFSSFNALIDPMIIYLESVKTWKLSIIAFFDGCVKRMGADEADEADEE